MLPSRDEPSPPSRTCASGSRRNDPRERNTFFGESLLYGCAGESWYCSRLPIIRTRCRMRRLVLVMLSSLVSACGGGGPTAPSRPPTPLPSPSALLPPQAVDGVSGAALAAVIAPAQPSRNELTTVRAPGYLLREQLYTGEPIRLWPAKNEALVRQLVYVHPTTGAEIRLRRWEGSGFVVGLPPEVADSA